ncbi:hypothetical protein D9M68_680120 [compost metagenome]
MHGPLWSDSEKILLKGLSMRQHTEEDGSAEVDMMSLLIMHRTSLRLKQELQVKIVPAGIAPVYI